MRIHFKPTGTRLDQASIKMLLPLRLGAEGIYEEPSFENQEDGSLIVELPGVTTETIRQGIIETCKICLESWGDMTFDVLDKES